MSEAVQPATGFKRFVVYLGLVLCCVAVVDSFTGGNLLKLAISHIPRPPATPQERTATLRAQLDWDQKVEAVLMQCRYDLDLFGEAIQRGYRPNYPLDAREDRMKIEIEYNDALAAKVEIKPEHKAVMERTIALLKQAEALPERAR